MNYSFYWHTQGTANVLAFFGVIAILTGLVFIVVPMKHWKNMYDISGKAVSLALMSSGLCFIGLGIWAVISGVTCNG